MTKRDIKKQILQKLNTIGGSLVVLCTIFSFGVGTGAYVANIFHKMELNEVSMKHNLELIEIASEFDEKKDSFRKEIDELRREKFVLQNKLKEYESRN